jgi:hypothetical protein
VDFISSLTVDKPSCGLHMLLPNLAYS